jgi:hypothetical protein
LRLPWKTAAARVSAAIGGFGQACARQCERRAHSFNRLPCTGEGFGGFNLSGTDSKAGGRDYLLLFLQGKSITKRF